MCMCLCVCLFFVPYARPQFWVDMHEIRHVASLYPADGHVVLASGAQCARIGRHNGLMWAPLGNLEVAASNCNGMMTNLWRGWSASMVYSWRNGKLKKHKLLLHRKRKAVWYRLSSWKKTKIRSLRLIQNHCWLLQIMMLKRLNMVKSWNKEQIQMPRKGS